MTLNPIKWQQIDTPEALGDFWPQWDALAARGNVDTLFNSSLWLRPWLAQFWQDDWQLAVQVAWMDGRIVAILPVYIQPQHALALPLGQGEPEYMEVASEYLDILIEPDTYPHIAPALLSRLRRVAPALQWRALKQDAWLLKLLATTPHTARRSTQYRVDVEQFSPRSLSKNTRAQHNRGRNKLSKHHQYSLRWARPDEYSQLFEHMRKLHEVRWNNAGKGGAFQSERFIAFHQQLFNSPGDVAMSVLDIDGEPAAIHYYLRHDTTLYFYQSGWDSARFSRFSPGLLLHCWSIEHCECAVYDFMMGAAKNSYKAKLATTQAAMVNVTVPFSLIATLIWRLKRVLRRLR